MHAFTAFALIIHDESVTRKKLATNKVSIFVAEKTRCYLFLLEGVSHLLYLHAVLNVDL